MPGGAAPHYIASMQMRFPSDPAGDLEADRFGFMMGVDDLFWRSLVWAARKPFVVRGYPRRFAVQMDDADLGWAGRIADMYRSAAWAS